MKISNLTQTSGIYGGEYKNKSVKQNINNYSTNSIPDMSMQEAIGRSQVVSFAGKSKMNGSEFTHSCSDFLKGKEEIIRYNKENGSFTYSVFKNGVLESAREFNPASQTETETRVSKSNGERTVTTQTPYFNSIEKTDNQGRQIYYQVSEISGRKQTIVSEYNKNRKIVTTEYNGNKTVEVINMMTNKPETSGDIVLRSYYDSKTNTYYTKNIVTGQIVKVEEMRGNNSLGYFCEYSQNTGNMIYEKMYDDATGGYTEVTYGENGIRKSVVKISKDELKKEYFEYAADGKTLRSHIKSKFAPDGNISRETVYSPKTGAIQTQTEYNNNERAVIYFSDRTKAPCRVEVYQRDAKNNKEFLSEEIEYNYDGRTYSYNKINDKDGSYVENAYDRYGYITASRRILPNGKMQYEESFSVKTGKRTRRFEYDEKSSKMKREIEYFSDGETRKTVYEYKPDGYIIYYEFNEDGYLARKEILSPQNNQNAQKSGSGVNNQKGRDTYDYAKIIEDIEHAVSLEPFNQNSVPQKHWKYFGESIGIEDTRQLFNMDTKTYKELATKYHPDRYAQSTVQEQKLAEQIFKIVGGLYKLSKAN